VSPSDGWADRIRAEVLDQQSKARKRAQATAQAIRRGEISVPLRCGECRSPSWVTEQDGANRTWLVCLQCSRYTSAEKAHELRQQEIRMIIRAGGDPRPTNRRGV